MSRIEMNPWSTTSLAALISMFVIAIDGQAQFEFAPYAGVYVPTRIVDDASHYACIDPFPSTCSLSPTKQKTAAIAGGRVSGWLTPRLGVESVFGYSTSDLKGAGGGPASIGIVSGWIVARVSPPAGSAFMDLNGGGALVLHDGGPFGGDVSAWGPAFGSTGGMKFSRLLAVRADVEDYVYRLKETPAFGSGGPLRSYPQNDVVISVGLAATLVGR